MNKEQRSWIHKLLNIASGKGKWIVILHAGNAEIGLIPDCKLLFVGTHYGSEDYHTEMNTKLSMEWFDKLFLDNALYHNLRTDETKSTNMNSLKPVMQQWLKSHKIISKQNRQR